MQNGQVTKSKGKLRNVFRGITPTTTYFKAETPLVNPERSTDGDKATYAGPGGRETSGVGSVYVTYDVGSVKRLLVGGRVGMWSTTGTMKASVQSSDDNIAYTSNGVVLASMVQTEETQQSELTPQLVTGRYILFVFQVSAAATLNVKPYEMFGYELE